MTRARNEVAAALVAVLGLLLVMAWSQGPHPLPHPGVTPSDSLLHQAPLLPGAGDSALVTAPMFGTVHGVPVPELPARGK